MPAHAAMSRRASAGPRGGPDSSSVTPSRAGACSATASSCSRTLANCYPGGDTVAPHRPTDVSATSSTIPAAPHAAARRSRARRACGLASAPRRVTSR